MNFLNAVRSINCWHPFLEPFSGNNVNGYLLWLYLLLQLHLRQMNGFFKNILAVTFCCVFGVALSAVLWNVVLCGASSCQTQVFGLCGCFIIYVAGCHLRVLYVHIFFIYSYDNPPYKYISTYIFIYLCMLLWFTVDCLISIFFKHSIMSICLYIREVVP